MRRGPKPRPLIERILANVIVGEDGCWIWQLRLDRYGYGQIQVIRRPHRRTCKVHRVAYELLVGPIPDGLDLDHLCKRRACCNPDHLEPVTRRENVLRGDGLTGRAASMARHPTALSNVLTLAEGTMVDARFC